MLILGEGEKQPRKHVPEDQLCRAAMQDLVVQLMGNNFEWGNALSAGRVTIFKYAVKK